MRRKCQFSGVALVALMWSGIAVAQDAPTAAEASGAATSAGSGIGEIVVTANKREQNLNDVGVTAAVMGGDALKQQNLSSLSDVASRVPSLSYAAAPNGTPVYTLRGVGFYETSIGAYPSVSIYVDEIPLSFPVLTTHSTFDLERLEVLKGPQGTLFGQNATGGAINYIAAKPTDTFRAGATVTYGRFNQVDAEGYVSGPITDTLKARVAGRAEFGDGWQVSTTRPGDRNGKVENYMGRLQVVWEPVSSLRFLLNVNGWKDKSETQAGQYIAQQFQNEGLAIPPNPVGSWRDPAILATPFSANDPRAADWSNSSTLFPGQKVPFADNDMIQASLRADLDVGDFGTLTSLTAYTRFNERQGNDSDGMAINALDVPLTLGRIETVYQELRFANNPHNPFRFVLGGNYEWDKVDQQVNIDYFNSSARIGFGDLFGFPLSVDTITNNQRMRNYAFFGNVEYDVIENLTLKAGIRYTNARDKANICQSDPRAPYNLGNILKYFGAQYQGIPFQRYIPGECVSINVDSVAAQNGQFVPVVDYLPFGGIGDYHSTLAEDNVSWRVGADYKLTPGTLLYVNVSKGYKAGSFPSITGSTLNQYVPVHQESVLAYEGGIKATLLDRTLQVNLAGFYYDYRDKQLRTKLLDPTFGQLDVLQNIPKSSIKGFELELTARPSNHLTVNAAYTYLDARIDKFKGFNAGGDPEDFAGTAIPYTPKHQVSVSANYNQPVTSSLNMFLGATINYRSKTIATLGGDVNPSTVIAASTNCVYCINDYAVIDAQIGIEDTDKRWRAFIWGKNIGNAYYWTNVVSGYDTVSRFAGRPATYGVTLSYDFR
ncbi:TonB-dependent receptor [Sphingomonas sp. CL5.1]|nr:TonB-dependent receptor [Sphingomonas sp. CL5.1]